MLKLRRTKNITFPVKVRIPTDNPNTFNEGTFIVQAKVKSKEELAEYTDRGLNDAEYLDELVVQVEGLGDEDGNPITDEAALTEVKTGLWSSFLTPAILQEYFERMGESRVKNSKPSRSR